MASNTGRQDPTNNNLKKDYKKKSKKNTNKEQMTYFPATNIGLKAPSRHVATQPSYPTTVVDIRRKRT